MRAFLRATGLRDAESQSVALALAPFFPHHERTNAARAAASLTDSIAPLDQIRFRAAIGTLRKHVAVVACQLRAQGGPTTIVIANARHLDEGSRLFFTLLAACGDDLEVDLRIAGGASDRDLLPEHSPEQARVDALLAGDHRQYTDDDMQYLARAAKTHMVVGDPWTGARIWPKLIARDPQPPFQYWYGMTLALLDRSIEAEFWLRRVLATDSKMDHVYAYYNLSMLYTRHHPPHLRSIDRAAEFLERAHAILCELPDDTPGLTFDKVFNRNGYALILFRRGQVEEALHLIDAGLAKLGDSDDPSDALHRSVLLYNRAQCLQRMGVFDRAYAAYRELVDFDPNFTEYHTSFAVACIENTDYETALEVLAGAEAIDPLHSTVQGLQGYCLRMLDDKEGSLRCYQRAFEIAPLHPRIRCDYAYALALVGRRTEAVEVLDGLDVVDLEVNYPGDEHELLARAITLRADAELWSSGDLSRARAILVRGLETLPDNAALSGQLRRLDAVAGEAEAS